MNSKSPFKFNCEYVNSNSKELHTSDATNTNHKIGATNMQANFNSVGDEMPEINNDQVCKVTPGPNDCTGESLIVGGKKEKLDIYNVIINNRSYKIYSNSNIDAIYYCLNNIKNIKNIKNNNIHYLIEVKNKNRSYLYKYYKNKLIKLYK